MNPTAFVLSMFLLFTSACGYLDDDLLLDDEQYEQSLTFEGMSISGSSGWGCGGRGHYSRRHRYSRPPIVLSGSSIIGWPGMGVANGYYVNMRDEELLELSDIDQVEAEEGDEPGTVSVPAEVYYAMLASRNEGLAETYK